MLIWQGGEAWRLSPLFHEDDQMSKQDAQIFRLSPLFHEDDQDVQINKIEHLRDLLPLLRKASRLRCGPAELVASSLCNFLAILTRAKAQSR